MNKILEEQIKGLRERATEIEQWLLENNISDDPQKWRAMVSKYHSIIFDLNQKKDKLYNEDHEVPYYQTTYLPRYVNKSKCITR